MYILVNIYEHLCTFAMTPQKNSLTKFLKKQGLATYADIMKAGFKRTNLNKLLRSGKAQKIGHNIYKLTKSPSESNPDFAIVAIKAPRAVVCLISALAFHEATDEIPRQIDLAIPQKSRANKINYPPVRFYRFTQAAWETGIEKHKIGIRSIRVYNLAKTIADCFKFRNKIGVDIARSALKTAVTEKHIQAKEIMHYAKICRVHNIVKLILETLL